MHIDDLKKKLGAYAIVWQGSSGETALLVLEGVRRLPYTWAKYDFASDDNHFVVYASFRGCGEPQSIPKSYLEEEINRAIAFVQGVAYVLKTEKST